MIIILKLMGVILITITGYSIGNIKVQKLFKRIAIFETMLKFVDELLLNIKHKRDNICNMLTYMLQKNNFSILEISLESGKDWPETLNNALLISQKQLCLFVNTEEYLPFRNAILEIGKTYADNEVENLIYYREKIKILYVEACSMAKQNSKLYKMLGLAAGLAVAVLII